ncbi:MAG: hypothetical protein M1835_001275 [Candelina submexicana]|nr:MAG: hypothetical protein M1835_001275 [Candelina submexicana]
MPHKHRRNKLNDGPSYELPPSTVAKPLPVIKQQKVHSTATLSPNKSKSTKKKRLNKDINDDTPRAFSRLLQYQALGRHADGLDDGIRPKISKKRKRGDDSIATGSVASAPNISASLGDNDTKEKPEVPTIRPGERMSEFSARVDTALPVSGLVVRGKDNGRITKTEMRMQKMYAQWREEEKRRQEKLEEAMEEAEGGEDIGYGRVTSASKSGTKKKKKGKRIKVIGEEGGDEDPWAGLNAARGGPPSSLHDIVQAPPQLSNVPKDKFKVKDGARVEVVDVPNAAGSLRKREELGEARRRILEGYRHIMETRRRPTAVS